MLGDASRYTMISVPLGDVRFYFYAEFETGGP